MSRDLVNSIDVEYDKQLKNKVVYPDMINMTHFYSYYKATHALKQSLNDSMPLILSTD